MALQELLAPIVALTGANLVVTNSAIGNNPVYPYTYCMEAHVGQTPDIVSWEVCCNLLYDTSRLKHSERVLLSASNCSQMLFDDKSH
jgi:hypothetical protein